MIEDGALDGVDAVIALHVYGTLETGQDPGGRRRRGRGRGHLPC
jgi:metal-dependent amidase/aminoacylase/carboxypeptidase family protein